MQYREAKANKTVNGYRELLKCFANVGIETK